MNMLQFIDYKYIPKVIFEAGCADGTHTKILAEFFKKSMIYAFEPVDEYYNIAIEKTKHLKNVKIFNLALGEKNEKKTLYISRNEDGSLWCSNSLLKPKEHLQYCPHIKFENETRIVDVVSLDSFCNDNNIENIDFFWMDMQGYEMKTLLSATKMINKINSIWTEINLVESYEGVELYDTYKNWLISKGFRLIQEEINDYHQGDALFIK